MNTRKILRFATATLLLLVFLFSGWQVLSTLSDSTYAYDYTGARYVLVGVLRELAPFVEGGNAA